MMRFSRLIAAQSSRPHGVVGRVWGPLLDRGTRSANRHAFEALALHRRVDVLEVGFGGGALLKRILAAADGHVAGVELSEAMVRRAGRRFRRELRSGRLRLAEGDVAALPFGEASFDRVVSVHTIYFWPDTKRGLSEIARVLRPGGVLVIGTATKEFLSGKRAAQHGYRLFGDAELRAVLEGAGFEDVAVERHDTIVISRGRRAGAASPA